MGWSSGTAVFDRVMGAIIQVVTDADDSYDTFVDVDDVYNEIVDAFRDADWDNLCESEYYNHPIVGKYLKIEEDEDGC
jgi:hypothetical protein